MRNDHTGASAVGPCLQARRRPFPPTHRCFRGPRGPNRTLSSGCWHDWKIVIEGPDGTHLQQKHSLPLWTVPPTVGCSSHCGRASAVGHAFQEPLTGCSCPAGAGVTVRARVLSCVDGVNVALLQKAVTLQRSFLRQRQREGHAAAADV